MSHAIVDGDERFVDGEGMEAVITAVMGSRAPTMSSDVRISLPEFERIWIAITLTREARHAYTRDAIAPCSQAHYGQNVCPL
jgi:hypothetical protein